MHALSIVIPVWNEENNIIPLVARIDEVLKKNRIQYEIIFIDDHSQDQTQDVIKKLLNKYPISIYIKQGKRGKAYSLIEGFSKAKYQIYAMIDADQQYPPEAIPAFLKKIDGGADIVVANRTEYKVSNVRKFISSSFRSLFGKILFGLHHDIQAGLKVFTKKVYETVNLNPTTGWAFDLEFLHRAKQAGYTIENYDIIFEKRQHGESKISFLKASLEIGLNALQVKAKKISPQHIQATERMSMKGAGVGFKKRKYITHTTLHYSQSAIQTFIGRQILFIFLLLGLALTGFIIHPIATLQVIVGILSFIYFVDVLFNLFLVLKSLHVPQEISIPKEELEELMESNLPVYSILCPLYKEAHIIPHFLDAIGKINYPKNKLDVLLLLEQDDLVSIEAVKTMSLPSYVRTIVVPDSLPKTKPKACNYGLSQARGEYLVIYDAEDIPDPLQLKKAYLGFQKAGEKVLCLQAKLNYYNPDQNLLTRFFTAEYSLWFDVTLTGLQSISTSIPLGGTSNHFRTADLTRLQGWDPFNVTEDADLGIRLFKEGYKTAIIDSTTMEEANSKYGNWLRQRSRWIKGYMQTYLVHTRKNVSFFRENGWHALVFHLVIGGKIAFILINPLLWIMTVSYFTLYAFVGPAIEALYPSLIFYMAAFSLAAGNFLFLYYYMIGCAKKGQWQLIKYVYLVPVYWLMISIAGSMALYQLIFKPHYWEKTVHGLHLKKQIKKNITEAVIETQEQNAGVQFPQRFRQRLSYLIKSKKIYISGGSLVVATVAANFLNYLFNAYLLRTKSVSADTFGLISLISVFVNFSYIPLNALGATVNYRSGFLDGKFNKEYSYAFWRHIRKYSFYIGLAFGVLWIAASPFLMKYFQSDDIGPFVLFGIVWLVGFVQSVDKGFLSGRLMFGSLAVVLFADAFIRMIFAVLFINFHLPHFTYTSIIIATVGSFLIGWFLLVWRKAPQRLPLTKDLKVFPKQFFFGSLISGLSSMTFLSLDIVLAKHFLSPTDAGYYSYISLVGKMVYFIGSLSSQFTLPLVSRSQGENKNSQRTLHLILFFTFLLTFAGFLVFGAFGFWTIPLLLSKKTLVIIPYVSLFCFAMMCFAVSRVFVSYYLTQKLYSFPVVGFLLSIFQFAFISFKHDNIFAIVFAMAVTGLLNLAVMTLLHYLSQYVRVFENNLSDFVGLFSLQKKPKEIRRNKLKILIFNWRDTKHVWGGGAESYVHELAKRWAKNGNSVTVFCGNDGHDPRNEVVDGVQIVRRGGFYTVYIWAALYYILRFRGLFDVIVDSENGIPFFTPLYSRKPIFLLIHHIHQEVHRKHLKFPWYLLAMVLEGKLMPYLYRNKTIITVSDSSKAEILKLGLGKKESIEIVHPGIDITAFIEKEKTSHPSFIYLGRLKPWKNVDTIIKAFATIAKKYPLAKLTVAGSGDTLEDLITLAKSLQVENQIIFKGRVTEKEKIELLAESWVALQPSMIEGWGITVIEANASGTPVIASNVNGLKDSIIDGKTGILVKVRDVNDFALAMQKCLDDAEFRKTLSKNAYYWSKNFSWDRSADNFYNRILYILESKHNHMAVGGVSLETVRYK